MRSGREAWAWAWTLTAVAMLLGSATAQQAACNAADAAALQDFKADFLENGVFAAWQAGADCCSFVTCNAAGRVTAIVIVADRIGVFPNPNSAGRVGASLGRLEALQSLTLIGVRFFGPIPRAWKALSSLSTLYVSLGNFTGAIPAEIGQLKSLNELLLYVGQLEGPLPAAVCQLALLQRLEIESQQLSGELPSCLPKLTRLRTLSLANNRLAGSIPSALGSVGSLEYLGLNNNLYSQSIPATLGRLSKLQTLRLNDNRLSGFIPPALGDAASLMEINLDDNQITGSIPYSLTMLRNLASLSCNHNRLSGPIPRHIGDFQSLTFLGLSYNRLSGSLPAEIGDLQVSATTGTVGLYIDHNSLSGPLPNTLSNVGTLSASYNRFTGGFPLSLCVSGYNVDLSHNLLDSGAQVGTLPRNSSLQILDLSFNLLPGAIPSWLSSVTSLTYLDISNNRFNAGGIPAQLLALKNLDTFKAADNRLRARLPTGSFQSSITFLDLHNVQLVGSVPAKFFPSFPNLMYLDMSRNGLEGPLPSNINQLIRLFHADLSSNKLVGKVPDLSALTQLTYLNLSGNAFQAPVPSIP